MSCVRTVVLGLVLAPSAFARDDGEPEADIHAGVRLGVASAFSPHAEMLPMASAHAEIRLKGERSFIVLSPGLFLPAESGRMTYGGLGADLGAGYMLTETAVAPYVGGGVSARLQFSDGASWVGFAPFANVGLLAEVAPGAEVFTEVRAYQNVLPVETLGGRVFPTEIGMAFGLLF